MWYKHQEYIIHYHTAHAKCNGLLVQHCTIVRGTIPFLWVVEFSAARHIHVSGIPRYACILFAWWYDMKYNLIYLQHILQIIQLGLTLWFVLSPYHETIIFTNRYLLPISKTVRFHICSHWFQPRHIAVVNHSIFWFNSYHRVSPVLVQVVVDATDSNMESLTLPPVVT